MGGTSGVVLVTGASSGIGREIANYPDDVHAVEALHRPAAIREDEDGSLPDPPARPTPTRRMRKGGSRCRP
jgi:hypothetical protein